ncbi:MAG TPA: protein-disulfide reductase DsbD domain-containing protein [Fimbriimonadaceae bacterium]|jgi:hypothetical protein
MCLEGWAHGLAPQNTIFNSPLPVDIKYTDRPTPTAYAAIQPPNSLPKTLPMWRVLEKDGTDKSSGLSYGVVASGKGFLDSPDTEVISSGVNEKGIDAVAIGRQGSFMFWGFESGPKNMTPSGRNAFLNSIVYISKFDHAPVLVHKVAESRDWTIARVNYEQNLSGKAGYEQSLEQHASLEKMADEYRNKAKTQKLTDNEESFVRMADNEKPQTYEEYLSEQKKSLSRMFPAPILTQCGSNPQALRDYYKANYKYLMPSGPYATIADEDCKALGIGNNDVRLLDKCVDMDSKGEDKDRALRILHRYTTVDFATAGEWRAWLNENRSHLFFSDVAGYKFLSNKPMVAAAAVSKEQKLVVTQDNPVAFGASATCSGSVVTLKVNMALMDGWHIYASAPENSAYIVTKMDAELPKGATFEGDWSRPIEKLFEPGVMIIEGSAVFSRKVKFPAGLTGSVTIPVTLSWQTCDRERCLPPDSKTFNVTVALN